MLQLHTISKVYGKRTVLDQLSLEITKGETIAIVGPSGSGKTTLLNIIGTLDAAESGSVFFKQKNIASLSEKDKAFFRNQELGMIFQLHHLLPQLTLWENVLLPTIQNKSKNDCEARAEDLLKQTGIWEQRFQKPSELSGGECQRAAVVRALINQPSIILADEPTGALDHDNASKLIDLLIELNSSLGTSLIVVTHSIELAQKMQKVYQLIDGRLEEMTF